MHLPGPFRAAVGLAATAADELKSLPDRAVELPMVAVSTVLQLSLRAQQRYTQLATRGEQVLNREQPNSEPPPWATFDEPATPAQLRRAALSQLDSLIDGGADDGQLPGGEDAAAAAARHPSASGMFEELFGVSDPAENTETATPDASVADTDSATVTPINRAVRKTAAKKATRKTPAKKAAAANAPAKKAPAKKAAAKKTPAKPAAASEPTSAKQVSKPRDREPSKFDSADDQS